MNIVPFREWDTAQRLDAFEAMKAHPGFVQRLIPFVPDNAPFLVWQRLERRELRAALVAGYLVIYDIGASWCSEDDLLHEYLTIRMDAAPSFTEYVAGLRYIAEFNRCVGIITGNAVLRPGLRKLYEREGFVKQNEAYFLGVQHGQLG